MTTISIAVAMSVLDRRDRQHRAAHHRAGAARDAGGLDLGGERLSARGDSLPARLRVARRYPRLQADLLDRPGWCSPLASLRLRAVRLAAGAGGRAGGAGLRRRRHHEREHRAGSLHLSARRSSGRGIGINAFVVAVASATGPVDRRGDPVGGELALAVRRQRAARRHRAVAGGTGPAGHAAIAATASTSAARC